MKTIKVKYFALAFLVAMSTSSIFAQRLDLNESRFFIDNIPDNRINVTNLTGGKNTTDSNTLNQLIDETSQNGGGTIYLLPHNGKNVFYLNQVHLKSNIHLKIDPRVTIENLIVNSNTTVFNVGDRGLVENVAITSTKENSRKKTDAFNARIVGEVDRGVSLIALRYVKNFKVSGIDITDDYTKFNNIVMNLSKSKDKTKIATGGIVQNIYTINNHVGYGAVQTQSAKTVLFKNINCTGGTALRIESGSGEISVNNIETVNDIVGKGIKSINGLCAVDLSPHRVNQGQVDISGIRSIGSTYAVIISGGFKDRKEVGSINNLGTFSDKSYIQISKAVGGNLAQVKGKDFQFYNCVTSAELKNRAKSNADEESTNGISIAVVRHSADPMNGCTTTGPKARGCYSPEIVFPEESNITGTFERSGRSKKIVYDGDKIRGCGRASLNTLSKTEFNNKEENVSSLSISQNRTLGVVNVRGAKSKITVYGITGQVIMELKSTKNNNITQLNVSKLNKGIYLISDGIQTKKFIHY